MSNKEEHVHFLKGKVDNIRTAMLTTFTAAKGFHARPMGTADIDADGNIWFFTNEYSAKAKEISMDNKVGVTYADAGTNTYLSIKGSAILVDDREKMKALWNPFISAFFPDGINDPKLVLLKVETTDLEYWDSNSSKIVVLFNMLKANLLGKQYDEGEHGKVKL
jgi:general stress protein 26